ncbi:SAM-dependent methyltransferase [Streptomyces sp. DSM 44917]|uniref:SAM-dependent methyltransferase n=1 Tax=Streptomyces boetiae TaxID=3075541 RepID=A0ABU2LF51_9ACTN|nr:SAM-dependent methyltransferase [Streptomyces sp. DSM 44917]MDT0310218.1 SAM-dependent methyltransferase [Streptomyces sp. DSM 44917]
MTAMTSTTAYAFLLRPSHNRVYAQASHELARAELRVFGETALRGRIADVDGAELGGVPYVTFSSPGLPEGDLRTLAALSSLHALFEVRQDAGDAGPLLRPVALTRPDRFPSDLLTIQKYPGKTNEDFTRLLLNVTAMACDRPEGLLTGGLRVFDPLCGRGTTLNQALMYGLDSAGVERDAKSFEAYQNFLRQWLKNSRLKHRAESGAVRRDRRTLGRRFHVEVGESKESYKQGRAVDLTMVQADTAASGEFFRPGSFDLIVTDAPYGVQHGSSDAGGRSRSPLPLLAGALPAWTRLLRVGGAIGISWNTYVASREELAELLAGHGFEVRDSEAHRAFRHRVDHAILRDLIVARRVR